MLIMQAAHVAHHAGVYVAIARVANQTASQLVVHVKARHLHSAWSDFVKVLHPRDKLDTDSLASAVWLTCV